MPLTDTCAKLLLSSVEYDVPICIIIVMCNAILNKDIHDKKGFQCYQVKIYLEIHRKGSSYPVLILSSALSSA